MLVFEEGSLTIKLRDPDSDFWEKIIYDLVEEKQGLRLVEKMKSCGFGEPINMKDLTSSICINNDKRGWMTWQIPTN